MYPDSGISGTIKGVMNSYLWYTGAGTLLRSVQTGHEYYDGQDTRRVYCLSGKAHSTSLNTQHNFRDRRLGYEYKRLHKRGKKILTQFTARAARYYMYSGGGRHEKDRRTLWLLGVRELTKSSSRSCTSVWRIRVRASSRWR